MKHMFKCLCIRDGYTTECRGHNFEQNACYDVYHVRIRMTRHGCVQRLLSILRRSKFCFGDSGSVYHRLTFPNTSRLFNYGTQRQAYVVVACVLKTRIWSMAHGDLIAAIALGARHHLLHRHFPQLVHNVHHLHVQTADKTEQAV